MASAKKLVSPPRGKLEPVETDPYSPVIVQELLQGSTEWLQIHDIVKLTFKAMLDVMKAHSEAIKELERVVPSKASKSELNTGLSQKASISDVSKTVAEVAANIESRATIEEVQQLLESKISKSDFQYALSNKVGIDELRIALEQKVGYHDIESDIKIMKSKIEQIQAEVQHKLENSVSLKDFEEIKRSLDSKASLKEVTESLNSKANKDSVATALNKKANRDEFTAILSKKVETTDLQNVVAAVENKADSQEIESLAKSLEKAYEKIAEVEKTANQRANPKEIQAIITEKTESQKLENEKNLINIEKEMNTIHKSMSEELAKIEGLLNKKVDLEELERIKEILENKSDSQAVIDHFEENKKTLLTEIEKTRNDANKKVEDFIRTDFINAATNITTLQSDIKRLNNTIVSLSEDRAKESEEIQKALESVKKSVKLEKQDDQREQQRELAALRKEIDLMGQKKCDKKELQDLKAILKKEMETKVDLDEVKTVISDMKSETAKRFVELSDDTKKEIKILEKDLSFQINKKANSSDIAASLEQKVERSVILPLLDQKANATDIEILKSRYTNLNAELSKKADGKELDTHTLYTKESIEEIKKEVSQKANIKDVCALIDIKANVEDVNKSLESIDKEIVNKATAEELKEALSSQAIINEALCAENCAGRWIWKSGTVKSGYAIPWEIQSVNTCPDNFLWEKDKISILTVAPGLYEISLGFFSSKKPNVQLLVNGEPVLTPVNSSRYFSRKLFIVAI